MNANAALYFVDRHLEEGRGEKTAFLEADGDGRSLTYGVLAEASDRFAGALHRQGVRREERVALILLDQIEYPVAFWGCLKAGVIPVLLNTLLSTDVYDGILADARASMLFVSEPLWETVAPAVRNAGSLRDIVVVGNAPEGALSYEAFLDGAPARGAVDAHTDELAFWLYSSGSTGLPKGVRHVHSSLKATADTFGSRVLGIRADDIVYSAAKIFFAYGLGNAMSFPMAVGATTVLLAGRPAPDAVAGILEVHEPTLFCGVPTLFAAMLAAFEAGSGPPKHMLRLCLSAGEALPKEVGETWKRLTGVDIVDGVGSTEMLHIFLSNTPNDIVYGSSGGAVPGYDVRLVDEAGADVGPGEIGELLVSGPSAAEGYWNRREKSRSTFEGHWTRTGDKYEVGRDGRYVYCGRTDDMFKVSGIWVSPFEVEQALIEYPPVLEAAVVPGLDEAGLEKPKAYVVLKNGQGLGEPEALKDFVKDKIGKWKYPRWVEVVDELPKTATGKIQRFKLRGGA